MHNLATTADNTVLAKIQYWDLLRGELNVFSPKKKKKVQESKIFIYRYRKILRYIFSERRPRLKKKKTDLEKYV